MGLKMLSKKEIERRKKISESLKRTLAKPEEKAKRIAQLTGRKMSPEARKKQSESKLIKNGAKGTHKTKEQKEHMRKLMSGRNITWGDKISKTKKGKKMKPEYALAMSERTKGKRTGKDNPFYGKHHSEKTKQLLRNAMIGRFDGPKHPQWNGGTCRWPYPFIWKEMRIKILERDEYTCQNPDCKHNSKKISVHHIDYDKDNCVMTNLITLCNSCNIIANYDREFWYGYYMMIMRVMRYV